MSNIKLNDILQDILAESTKLSSSDIKNDIANMLNLGNNDVSVSLSSPYNQIKFTIKQDIEEKNFNKVKDYLKKNGYTVDVNQSYRTYSNEDGKSEYPRIRFSAKLKPIKEGDFKRFDFQNTQGGGGRRFIPNQGIIPSSMLNDKDFMLSNDSTKLYMDPLLVNAIVNSKTLTNRAAQVRYQEFKEKMGPHFQQFKKGLEGRLSKVVKSGKPFEVWNGTIMTNKKGQVVFPYSDIGNIAENEN